jgi:hypothetical protein
LLAYGGVLYGVLRRHRHRFVNIVIAAIPPQPKPSK